MTEVAPVRYRPHDRDYELDIEILTAGELRSRVAVDATRGFERVDFQCFLYLTGGTYEHTVDFETHRLSAGSCVTVSPGQVHRFGPGSDWRGWLLIVSAHRVPAAARSLPTHVRLTGPRAAAVSELLARMDTDVRSSDAADGPARLLELQTIELVERLWHGTPTVRADRLLDEATLSRYREYVDAVDRSFRTCHRVATYAHELGCSTKSLNRACRAAAGASAKEVISARIVLESKRMLAHGDEAVSTVGRRLGFDEATNFVKYFRRETSTTPAAFRASLRTAPR